MAALAGATRRLTIGVSEGAGLSVLAAADARVKPLISGVVGLGLPDLNELGWRWQDSLIYLTHGAPKEPSFSTASLAAHVSPKRLWIVKASNHSFSDNLPELEARLLDAIDWVRQHQAR